MPARVVIDTNTFLSAIIRLGSVPSLAVERAIAEATLLVSLETLHELEDVLLRARFERYQAITVRRKFLESLESYFEPVSVRTRVSVCRHPKNDKFLELAVDGRGFHYHRRVTTCSCGTLFAAFQSSRRWTIFLCDPEA